MRDRLTTRDWFSMSHMVYDWPVSVLFPNPNPLRHERTYTCSSQILQYYRISRARIMLHKSAVPNATTEAWRHEFILWLAGLLLHCNH